MIEEITNGMIMNVTVISVRSCGLHPSVTTLNRQANPIMRYQFELSRLGVEEHIDKWVQRDKEDQEMRLEALQAFEEWQRAERNDVFLVCRGLAQFRSCKVLELEEEEKKKERPKFKPGQWKQRYGMRCAHKDG